MAAVTGTRADIDKWDAAYESSRNPEDMRKAIYSRYKRHRGQSNQPKPFASWMVNLISAQVSGQKGGVFETKAVQDFNLVGPAAQRRSTTSRSRG
ncbi:hypothetical protein SLA_4024 [Streptomyces laurentii]|uniref:Uncharacterized protein n=1 Tax=Streptomyces laurentii TaxID=39478 RepID=A0A160P332_STRLU|nr:hypothetical protein SLA_4024 [Streptomyces laurentii]